MSVLEKMIGWLAPPFCISCGLEGSALCDGCRSSEILFFGERCYSCGTLSPRSRTCSSCRSGSPRFAWVATDYDNLPSELLKKYKFAHMRAAAMPIAALMVEALLDYNGRTELYKANYLVVPVPTAGPRLRERGFDHAELLASHIAAQLNLKSRKILQRRGHARQVGAKREVRMKQQAGLYYVPNPTTIHGRNVLLVDDVVTTGATLRAATKALRGAGARHVDALIFAKAL
ncbi:MAG TPA: phosphoribosyltransferase family protein [Candidatus Saccharimonadales bacterium]|nr:phosphoribosyltransferase family protein [Candidatus Saccharimonadales bacterium]